MNFTDLVKAVANSGASYDEQAEILKIYFELRDRAKKDYNEAVTKYHEVRSYYSAKAAESDRELVGLRNENTQLKAALAEARAALPSVVKVAIGEICRKVIQLQDRKIDCIKLIRSDKKLVDDGSGDPIALRLAKELFELVGAAEGVSCAVSSRVNDGHQVNGCTSYYNLKREVEALVKAFYPSYKVELLDE